MHCSALQKGNGSYTLSTYAAANRFELEQLREKARQDEVGLEAKLDSIAGAKVEAHRQYEVLRPHIYTRNAHAHCIFHVSPLIVD